MKKFLFLLCALIAFSVASAQTDKSKKDKTATKSEIKKENKQVNMPEKKAEPSTSVANDSTGLIDPTDTNAEGSNSRNNSRQNNYNNPNPTGSGNSSGTGNNTTTPRPKGQ